MLAMTSMLPSAVLEAIEGATKESIEIVQSVVGIF